MSPPLGAVTNRLPFIAASLRCIISRLPVFVNLTCRQPPTKPLSRAALCGTIKTEEAGTLDFSGVPAFFVTTVLIVQCSAAYNVHRIEPYLISSTVAFSSSKVL